MIPEEPVIVPALGGIPRESGDDPYTVPPSPAASTVFPARAGMILNPLSPVAGGLSIPRESGDDPSPVNLLSDLLGYSPRERG